MTLPETGERPSLFLGSSSEGRDVARNLQSELEALSICEVVRWDQGVFEASGYTIDSLVAAAQRVDFAVLVATPDDVVSTRGSEHPVVRDNVIFEFGLFIRRARQTPHVPVGHRRLAGPSAVGSSGSDSSAVHEPT